MTKNKVSSSKNWPAPILDRKGQQTFWDRQAPTYDLADMTLDNAGELKIVESLSRDFVTKCPVTSDIVTLGGAVGSRDPKTIIETMLELEHCPSHIYFNDLSVDMTRRAIDVTLQPYVAQGTRITAIPGPIHEIEEIIPRSPRRVILGAYRARALIEAYPHLGYPLSGIEEYLKNSAVIGSRLRIEPLDIRDGQYQKPTTCFFLTEASTQSEKNAVCGEIIHQLEVERVDAIRVVGTHEDKDGFFISHWFSEEGLMNLIRRSFNRDRRKYLSVMPCAKGYVVCIDPIENPRGIVTILNNVIGNILPHEQIMTLEAIDRISS